MNNECSPCNVCFKKTENHICFGLIVINRCNEHNENIEKVGGKFSHICSNGCKFWNIERRGTIIKRDKSE